MGCRLALAGTQRGFQFPAQTFHFLFEALVLFAAYHFPAATDPVRVSGQTRCFQAACLRRAGQPVSSNPTVTRPATFVQRNPPTADFTDLSGWQTNTIDYLRKHLVRYAKKLGITGFCLCAALNAATGVAVAQLTSFDDLVSRLLTKWEIKGAALAVSHDGRLILARGNGSTDVDAPVQILRVAVGLDGSRPPGFLKQARPQAMAAPSSEVFDRALVLREAAGVDVVLLFDSWPADRAAFEADVSAGVAQVANSIKDWPPVDRFVEGPVLFARDVINAAATTGGQVVPGQTILLFPSNAGPTELARLQVDRDGRVSSMIGETRVLFDGIPAPMGYAVIGHICAIVPYEVS